MFVWTKNMKKYEMQIMKSLSNFYEETSYSKNSKKKPKKKHTAWGGTQNLEPINHAPTRIWTQDLDHINHADHLKWHYPSPA